MIRPTFILAAILSSAEALVLQGKVIDDPTDLLYFNKDIYQAKTKEEKMAELWSMIVPDESVVEEPIDFHWTEWGSLFEENMAGSFHEGDEMPRGRSKLAHT